MKVGILGAGVAGLSCALLLEEEGIDVIMLESQPHVGGLARSFEWHGFNCDFAAHRLFTKDIEVLERFLELTPMLEHERRSQIYFNRRWMKDPLDVIELVRCTNAQDLMKIVWSYLRRTRSKTPDSFATFVQQRYGSKLYDYFFRPYTEKLFGISGANVALSWAEEKVRLAGPLDRFKQSTKTKFNRFYYPERGGYGAIATSMYDSLTGEVKLNSTVLSLRCIEGRISGLYYKTTSDGQEKEPRRIDVDALISTLPLTATIEMLGSVVDLSYRRVHAVYLLLDKPQLSQNHWTYFMEDDVVVNRLVEFKNMSPVDTPRDVTVVCAEVTCIDEDVIDTVIRDLVDTGLFSKREVLDSKLVTQEVAYPLYRQDYEEKVADARSLIAEYKNLFVVGRAAEHKHREVDDNFGAAADVVAQIVDQFQLQLHNVGERQVDPGAKRNIRRSKRRLRRTNQHVSGSQSASAFQHASGSTSPRDATTAASLG